MAIKIKGIETARDLPSLIVKYIGNIIEPADKYEQFNLYKGDNYYRARWYIVKGKLPNGGEWYGSVKIKKGIVQEVT